MRGSLFVNYLCRLPLQVGSLPHQRNDLTRSPGRTTSCPPFPKCPSSLTRGETYYDITRPSFSFRESEKHRRGQIPVVSVLATSPPSSSRQSTEILEVISFCVSVMFPLRVDPHPTDETLRIGPRDGPLLILHRRVSLPSDPKERCITDVTRCPLSHRWSRVQERGFP